MPRQTTANARLAGWAAETVRNPFEVTAPCGRASSLGRVPGGNGFGVSGRRVR